MLFAHFAPAYRSAARLTVLLLAVMGNLTLKLLPSRCARVCEALELCPITGILNVVCCISEAKTKRSVNPHLGTSAYRESSNRCYLKRNLWRGPAD